MPHFLVASCRVSDCAPSCAQHCCLLLDVLICSGKLWNQVAETFIDCTLEWGDKRCRSDTVRKAWALIIAFMMEKIKGGHLEQVSQLRHHLTETCARWLLKTTVLTCRVKRTLDRIVPR